MRTLQFIKKEMLHLLQAPESVLLMLLFPVLITWVLGTAFSAASTRILDVPEIVVPVVSDGAVASRMYVASGDESMITFEETTPEAITDGIANGSIQQYIELDGNRVIFHSDEQTGLDAMMVKIYTTAFIKQANLVGLAMQEGRLDQLTPQTKEFARVEGIEGRQEPGSFGYYGVTMLTMILMYGSLQVINLLHMEKSGRTGLRLKASPYPMRNVFVVKTVTACVIVILQALVLILINHYVYGVDYRSIPMVLMMLVPLAIFVTSLGVLSYQVFRNENVTSTFVNILTVALVFLGGGYMMVSLENSLFNTLAQFSPIGWVNQGLFHFIYRDNVTPILQADVKLLGISLVMYGIAYWLFLKEEGSDRVAAD